MAQFVAQTAGWKSAACMEKPLTSAEVRGPELPDLDSNQEPAGFTPAPVISLSDRRTTTRETHQRAGMATVSTFPVEVGA